MSQYQAKQSIQHTNKMFAYLALIFIALMVVLLLWLPFGFALTGIIEEWRVLGNFNKYGLFFFVDTNGLWGSQATRPLTVFPHAVAYYLDSNSFYYWHVLLMLVLVVKGSAAGQLVWKTTRSIGWALVTGALLLLYPADTMQLSFRSFHINGALALFLLSCSLFLIAYEGNKRILNAMLVMFAVILSFAAICMYEASLLLVPLPFLLMFAKYGLKQWWQQLLSKISLVIAWLVAPILYVIYFVWISSKVVSYQSQLVGGSVLAVITKSLPNLFNIGVLRSLLGGWFDAIRVVATEYSNYTYLIMASSCILGFIFIATKYKKKGAAEVSVGLSLRLALVGLLLLMLGYAPFLLSPAHLSISQRTFLFASPGAVMVWIAFLIYISRWVKKVAWCLATMLIFLGLGVQLFQFNHYIKLAENERYILKSIIENINIDSNNQTIVIHDASNVIGQTWMLLAENLPYTLGYLYGHQIKAVEVCHMPSGEWQHKDELAQPGKCIETANDWIFQAAKASTGPGYIPPAKSPDLKLAKNKVISVTINPDGRVAPNASSFAYQDRLHTGNTLVALRYRNILAKKSWPLHLIRFSDQILPDYYKWSFGTWWSLEIPERGVGWRDAEWKVNKFYHQASAWKSQANSSFDFEFLPTKNHHTLQGKFTYFVSERIRQSTRILINQTNVPLRWTNGKIFSGDIPVGVLHAGLNRIDFNSEIDPQYYGLSSKLAWFEIAS